MDMFECTYSSIYCAFHITSEDDCSSKLCLSKQIMNCYFSTKKAPIIGVKIPTGARRRSWRKFGLTIYFNMPSLHYEKQLWSKMGFPSM